MSLTYSSPEAAELRRRRQALGLSQEQLAHRLGVSFASVNRWERGRSRPRGTTLRTLETLSLLAPAAAAALPSVGRTQLRNVVQPASRFLGREAELNLVDSLLAHHRLVTITGPGGCGKTRLAVEFVLSAGAAGGARRDLATFVTLEAIARDDDVVAEVAMQVVGVVGGDGVEAALSGALGDGRQLLVLDNCEHVLAGIRQLVQQLLDLCPALIVLATSREPLGLPAEAVVRLGPLDTSDASSAAVELFVDRARRNSSAYQPDHVELDEIATLCRRLDGMPLAIELAAAWVPALAAREVASRLSERFDLLVTPDPSVPARQRALRATFDWSYSRLSDREQGLLGRLSVFRGSFGLEAAEAVGLAPDGSSAAAVDSTAAPSVLVTLATLAQKSLLEVRAAERGQRYALLDSVRDYAAQRLAASGEADEARDLLFDWCLAFARRAELGMAGRDQQRWLELVSAEADNISAAISWAVEQGDAARAVALCGAIWRYWYNRSDVQRGLDHLAAALRLAGRVADADRAKALLGAGVLARQRGDFELATRHLRENLVLAQATGDELAIAQAHNSLAGAVHGAGDSAQAQRMLESSLDWWERSGDRVGLATTLSNLGVLASDAGEYRTAREYGEQALALRLALGHDSSIAISYENLGTTALRAGEIAEAGALFAEALRRYWRLGEQDGVASALEGLAGCSTDDIAVRLLAAGDRLRREIRVPRSGGDAEFHNRRALALRSQLGTRAFDAAWSDGAGMSLDEAVHLALAQAIDAAFPARGLHRRLGPREREVLALVAEGHTAKEMATLLGISRRTVEHHLAGVYAKIGARGRADAIAFALRHERRRDNPQTAPQ